MNPDPYAGLITLAAWAAIIGPWVVSFIILACAFASEGRDDPQPEQTDREAIHGG